MITITREMRPDALRKVENLTTLFFQGEEAAHEFIITPMDGISFDGFTPTARVVLSDGTDTTIIAPECRMSGDNVHVIMTPTCYSVPGVAKIFIYVVSEAETVCIYAATAQVISTVGQNGTAGEAAETIIEAYTSDAVPSEPAPGVYQGKDLTVTCAREIRNYASVWEWIQARVTAGDYTNIHVGDYIPVSCSDSLNTTINAVIMGINTYKGAYDLFQSGSKVPNHIDFMSDVYWPTLIKFNPVRYANSLVPVVTVKANGTDTVTLPMPLQSTITSIKDLTTGATLIMYNYDRASGVITLSAPVEADHNVEITGHAINWIECSQVYAFLNALHQYVPNGTGFKPQLKEVDYTDSGFYAVLPAALRNVIMDKRLNMADRHSSSELLTESDSIGTFKLGHVWLPTEFEVLGRTILGSLKYSGYDIQYPLFRGSARWFVPENAGVNSRGLIYTLPEGETNAMVATVYQGSVVAYNANNSIYLRPCFRVGPAEVTNV